VGAPQFADRTGWWRRLWPEAAPLHRQGQPQGPPPGAAFALSVHAERDSVALLDAAAYKEPSTKQASEALEKWGAQRPTLVVLEGEETVALKSFRNIERVAVGEATAVGVADLVGAASLVISQKALEVLQQRCRRQASRNEQRRR